MGLLCHRTTPIHNGFSPAELLMGRKLRTNLPMLPSNLLPAVPNLDIIRQKEIACRDGMKTSFDRRHGAGNLPYLDTGDYIYMPDAARPAAIVDGAGPRSYNAQTPDGVVLQGNRRASNVVHLPWQEISKCDSHSSLPHNSVRVTVPFLIRLLNRIVPLMHRLVRLCPSPVPVLRRSTRDCHAPSKFVPG